MKKSLLPIVLLCITLFSCKKENKTPDMVDDDIPMGTTVLYSGSFVSSGSYSTSGTVKITKDAADKRYLVIENFKSSGGPDLRVWLSPNTNGSPFQEIGLLKATNGDFFYELSASIDPATNNKVLIWCKQFSVLFGSATLQ